MATTKAKNQKKRAAPEAKPKAPVLLLASYALLIVLLVLYVIRNSVITGAAVIVVVVVILAMELKQSIRAGGVRRSLIDIGIAVLAVVIVFAAAAVILQTSSPIDVVTSCSMVPTLQRGEMLLLHGIPNLSTFLSDHDVPVVNVSTAAFDAAMSNFSSEFLVFYAYSPANKSDISETVAPNSVFDVGLYNQECLDIYSTEDRPGEYYKCYVPGQQQSALIRYNYSIGKIAEGSELYDEIYTSSITIENTTITENYSNPIVVYKTNANDSFYPGDVIHRVFAVMHVGSEYYVLTKGDNNPGLDIEFVNYPPSQNEIVGYYLGGLPYLGYLKLIVSGDLQAQAQCSEVIQH